MPGAILMNSANIQEVEIQDSVTSICSSAPSGCTNLTSITFEGTVYKWNQCYKGSSWNYDVPDAEVICSDGTVSLK